MEIEKKFFYSNGLEVAVSAYDFNLKFLRQGTPEHVKTGESHQPIKLDEMTISISPALAKTIAPMIFNAVNDYEKNIGKIAVDEKDQKAFVSAFGSALKK